MSAARVPARRETSTKPDVTLDDTRDTGYMFSEDCDSTMFDGSLALTQGGHGAPIASYAAAIIVGSISTVMGCSVSEINFLADNTTFVELGGDSLMAILVCADCQRNGLSIPAGVFLRGMTLKEVIAQAACLAQPTSTNPLMAAAPDLQPRQVSVSLTGEYSPATPMLLDPSDDESSSIYTAITTPDLEAGEVLAVHPRQEIISAKLLLVSINTEEWTDTQLLLLQETSHNDKLNMLTLHETYTSDWDIETITNTWTSTILSEPIFQDLLHSLNTTPQQLLLTDVLKTSNQGYEKSIHDAVNASGAISKLTILQTPPSSENLDGAVVVVWRIHHAFIDGYSARILREKIKRNMRNKEIETGPRVSFRETVESLRALQHERRESTESYWNEKRREFYSATGELRLSPQRVLEDTPASSQKSISIQFEEDQIAAARTRTGYTTAVYLAAAWALTLGKFMDAEQVYFGMVFSGRDMPISGAFDVVGTLINILPLFVTIPGQGDETTTVQEFLGGIHKAMIELGNVQHDGSTGKFYKQFDSIMATQFENHKTQGDRRCDLLVDQDRPDMQSGVPINLVIEPHCRLQIFYSTARYTEQDMENVRSILQSSMKSLVQTPNEGLSISRICADLLPEDMEAKIRLWGNCASSETLEESKGPDLITLFEQVVAQQPNETAILDGKSGGITYEQLDRAADAVAQRLTLIDRNEAVCVYADRSVNWLVAIFGVLKAGGVYAPLDPSAPESVRRTNFRRSGARAVLVPSEADKNVVFEQDEESLSDAVFAVDEILANMSTTEGSEIEPRGRLWRSAAQPDDLAYICFTSGSTGQPKAVQCTHKGLVAFQKDFVVRLAARRGTVVAQVLSPVFDGSIHEVFSALTYGATLRLASSEPGSHPFSHLEDADSAILTPSIAKALDPAQFPRLQNVYLVGEAVPQSVANIWAVGRSLYNMYGPSEATCGATIKQLFPFEAVTLGRPNPSSRVYILDRHQRLLPPGAVGELCIGGIQVSNGYIGLPELNAERFLDDPIMLGLRQKMYRTGDFAYWDSLTGEICIIGRKDRQIKLRGFRLDLDDLEARIVKAIPGCGGAAVIHQGDHLVAAYQIAPSPVFSCELDPSAARVLISGALPPYAMPRRILGLEEFPLTPAGKLDYKAVGAMFEKGYGETEAVIQGHPNAAMSATENMVVGLVRELMHLDETISINGNSNLTELGGHSILQLQLASRISTVINRRFTVRSVIDNPTISKLAAAVDAIMEEPEEYGDGFGLAQSERSSNFGDQNLTLGDTRVSPIERDWFHKYQLGLGTSSFNVTQVSEFDQGFDQQQRLIAAWNAVLARHTILRCRYRQSSATDSSAVERAYASDPPTAIFLKTLDIKAEMNREFMLGFEHPIRVFVSETHMLVCISHIICDYTTLNQLLGEVARAYLRIDDEDKEALTPAQKRYQDTTCWDVPVDVDARAFWESYLAGPERPILHAPLRTCYSGESLLYKLSSLAISSLQSVSSSLGLTSHQVVLAAVSLALQVGSPAKRDIILGSPYLGRQADDMQTVGLFLQPLPIRIPRRDTDGKMGSPEGCSVGGFLHAVRESSRAALSHGIHWDALLDILSSSEDEDLREAAVAAAPNHALLQAMVSFHELGTTSVSPLDAAIPGIETLISWSDGAKFGIMFEFSAVSSSAVTLRLEYDTSLYSLEEVRRHAARVDAVLVLLGEGVESSTLEELEQRLFDMESGHATMGLEAIEFGTRLSTLR